MRRFSGGVSNLTYLLRHPDGDLVLRRPPRGTHHKGGIAGPIPRRELPVIAQQVYQRYWTGLTTNRQFRLFGVAVVLLELRCRRLIARADRMDAVRAAAPVGR